jgi:hypothetical protein
LFFFLIFSLFFFQFHYYALNYLPLSFVIFSLLFIFCYFEGRLVKLTQVSLHFRSQCFLFNLGLFHQARPSFGGHFFFISISCYVWRVSRVNSSWLRFFPLIFYSFFFQFYHFALNYLSLSFIIFFIFLTVWLFRERVGKINLDWLKFLLTFFNWTLVFLLGHHFDFFLFRSHIMSCWFVKLSQVDSDFFFYFVFFEVFFLIFIFDIRLLVLEFYNFVLFFYRFFQSHISGCVLVNLTWVVSDYLHLNIIF